MRGFTLIEVLISLFLLAFTLLGFAALEIKALRDSSNALYFSIASNQILNIYEHLKATESQHLTEIIAAWDKQNQIVLPQASGKLTGQYPNYVVSIFWGENQPSCKKIQLGEKGG